MNCNKGVITRAATIVAGFVASGLFGKAAAQPFELVFEYRIDPSAGGQLFSDNGLAGALITERLIGDASQLPASINAISDGTQYSFDVIRELTISERTNGGPDIAGVPVPVALQVTDRDPGTGSEDSVSLFSTTIALVDFEIPPLGPATVQPPPLIVRGLDASTIGCVCEPSLGTLLGAFDPRTIDDGRFTLQGFVQFSFVFQVMATAERAVIASGAIAITHEPQNAIVPFGTPTVSFEVVANTATDIPTIVYQWRKDGIELADGPGIVGSNTPTLVVEVVAGSEGVYDCVLTTFGDQRVTPAAVLAFTAPAAKPDYNGDGVVDFFDVLELIEDIEDTEAL